jgi:transposase
MAPETQQLAEENDRLRIENRVLSLRVKSLEKELYGSRSDRRRAEDPKQGRLEGIEEQAGWDEAPLAGEGSPAETKPPRKKRGGKKKGPKPINPDLPRVDEAVPDPDLKNLICPVSGKLMRAAFAETVEVLARKPAEYYVRRLTRTVFTGAPEVAPVYRPWPGDVLPKSRIDASVIAHVLTARFADHQPYHRQCAQLRRHGLEFGANTLCSLVEQAHRKLEPICRQILLEVLGSGYLQMDPTPIPLMSDQKKGSTKEACMWTYRALDGPVCFEFSETKSGQTPAKTLQTYQGILQTDGATNFGGVPARAQVVHLNCWAHVRRYFVKAEESNDAGAAAYLDDIGKLFRIERRARHFKLRPDNLRKLRQHHSIALVDALFARARAYVIEERMLKTPLPKAVRYLLGREKELRACFESVPSRIDNNLAENALRPLKLGAKNWLFIGHANAGPRAAAMFTLVENCRIAGINPEAYFIDILACVDNHPASRIAELTPHGWAKSKNH